MLIAYFVPFDILLMKHITSSFETHYKVNLFDMVGRISGKTELQNYGSEKESEKYEAFLFPEANRISEASSSILVSGIGENLSNYENDKLDNNPTAHQSGSGTARTIKKS